MPECISNPSRPPEWPVRPVRVLLAGEQPVVLMGLALLFGNAPERIALAGTVHRLGELQSHAAWERVDVLFLDLGQRRASSIACLPSVVADGRVKVIVFVDDHDTAQREDAVNHGALGVVLKSLPPEAVLEAIERVQAGEAWVERSLVASLIRGRSRPALHVVPGADQSRRIAQLTQKEREVIASVVAHRGAKGFIVAESLGISEHTLRNRLTFIYDKLHIRGKLNLYLYALEHGLGVVPAAVLPVPDERAAGRR